MRKIITLFIIFSLMFFIALSKVNAKSLINYNDYIVLDSDCGGLLTDEEGNINSFGEFLQDVFNFIKYLGPTLVVVLTIVEFAKAAAANDKDALIKAGKKTGTRIALALLLFFLPVLIDFVFEHILHWYGTCGIS